MTSQITVAKSAEDILRCFDVMFELRPHLVREEFVETVRRQQQAGYHLVSVEASGQPVCVAGYRVSECLSRGRFLYVDDLVTASTARRHRHAAVLLDFLTALARELKCTAIHLDSGLTRHEAHSFYEAQQMQFTARHYSMGID